MQLSRLIGRKDEVVLGGFPGLGIGRISAIRQEDGTSPESHERHHLVWQITGIPQGYCTEREECQPST